MAFYRINRDIGDMKRELVEYFEGDMTAMVNRCGEILNGERDNLIVEEIDALPAPPVPPPAPAPNKKAKAA